MAALGAAGASAPALACGDADGMHVAPAGENGGGGKAGDRKVGDGSAAHPFETLEEALLAGRVGGVHRIVLEAGTFPLAAPLVLDARDDGTQILACADGQAVLDGGGSAPGLLVLRGARGVRLEGLRLARTGPSGIAVLLEDAHDSTLARLEVVQVGTAVQLRHASGNTVLDSSFEGMRQNGIEAKEASDCNRFEGNRIEGVTAPETAGGGVFVHGGSNTIVAYNLVQGTQGLGIGFLDWDDSTINRGNVVWRNVVRDTALGATDSGGIYVLGRSRIDTRMVIAENLVDGVGGSGQHSVGIYLDDSTSGARVSRNVLRRIGSDAVQIHGGSNNAVLGNVLDLGSGRSSAVLFQAAPADTHPDNRMTGNVVRGNVILSTSPHPKVYVWLDGGAPTIEGNLYHATHGVPPAGTTPAQDRDPFVGDPGFVQGSGEEGYVPQPDSLAARIGFAPVSLSPLGPRRRQDATGPADPALAAVDAACGRMPG